MKACITASAWRTPLGSDRDGVMRRLLVGERAARPDMRFAGAPYACRVTALIPESPAPSRHERFLRRMGLFGVEVGREAFEAWGGKASDRVGLFTAVGGLSAHWDELVVALARQRADGVDAYERGFRALHPFWMLKYLSNNVQALLAETIGVTGEGVSFGGAGSAVQAVSSAIAALEARAVDVALVVAYDALTEPENLIDHAARRVGATASMDVAAPYDARADGVVVGEAAAAIVLERCGGVATLQAADGCGEDGMAVLERLIAPWSGGAVLVDGCAAAKPEVDIREREMLARRLGTDALLTATGAAMGELGAAKPLVQVIALVEMLQRGVAAPVAGLRQVPGGGVSPLVRETRHGCRVGLALSWGAPGVGGVLGVERE